LFGLLACKSNPDCSTPTFNSGALQSKSGAESAKRAQPKPVTPIFYDTIQFQAPDSLMGFVVAKDKRTNKEIWTKQVYKVSYDKDLEQDVQDVFIDSLIVKCNYLFIHNEANQVYKIDINTLQITKL
jgi:hypothetical protein